MVVDVVVLQHAVPIVIEIDTDLQTDAQGHKETNGHTTMALVSQFTTRRGGSRGRRAEGSEDSCRK